MRAVQAPLDHQGTGGIRPLLSPEPVAVQESPDHQPAAIRQGNRWHRVDRIAERWSFDLWWLPKPLTRTYYRVDREDGRQVVLFSGPAGGLLVPTGPLARGHREEKAGNIMSGGYVELHVKSFYSFGLGASHTHELLAQAREYGYDALALTDTNLCGALEFARLAGSLGIRPITGGELTLTCGSRLVLLARTREGYANISRLFTLANTTDRREPKLDPRYLSQHTAGSDHPDWWSGRPG